jgi:hypothetical protein
MRHLSGTFHIAFTHLSPTFQVGEIAGKALQTKAKVHHLSESGGKDE